MKFNTFLFDLDETLVKSQQAKIEALKNTAKDFGAFFTDETKLILDFQYSRYPVEILVKKLRNEGIIFNYKNLKHSFWKHLRQNIPALVQPYSGVLEMLETLRNRRIQLGIVTSLVKSHAEQQIRVTNLGIFDCLIAFHDTGEHKPDPQPITTALSKLNAVKKRTIYIGDQASDIQAGKNAGVFTGWAVWGLFHEYRDKLQRINPDYIFTQPKDVLLQLVR